MKKDIANRQDIELLINTFYDKVKADDTIGYIFNDVAKVDWPHHMPIMYDFWEGIIFFTGNYKGNAMQVHKDLNERTPLLPEHFKQWLQLFIGTVDEQFEGDKAELAKQRAMGIATSIQIKITTT